MKAVTPRRAIGVGVAALIAAGSATAIASTVASPAPALPGLPSVVPSWLSTAKVLGATPADQPVWIGLTLRGPDDAGKLAFADAVSTPGNPLYRHFLTRAQYNAEFAPSAAAASTVASWLKSVGAGSVTVAPGNALIGASLPASLATTVLGVTFEEVSHGGVATRVPLTEPTLPATIAPLVESLSGLTERTFHYDHVVDSSAATPSFFNASPCTTYYNGPAVHNASDLTAPGTVDTTVPAQPGYPALSGDNTTTKPYDVCGYTPDQVRGAYGLNKTSYTGKGVAVAIVDAYDATTVVGDTNTYSGRHDLPQLATTQVDDISPPGLSATPEQPAVGAPVLLDPQGWAGEETLDWEAVHTMAPGATIVYSGAVTPVGPMLNVAAISAEQDVNETPAEITNSYGSAGDMTEPDKTEFDQAVAGPAASMGIGLEYSTGDSADEVGATQTREVDSPADSDMVTGVGGVGLAVGPNNTYGGEYYWGTYKATLSKDGKSWGTPLFSSAGGGGGVSTAYAEPDYQMGIADAYATNKDTGTTVAGRVLPDVSFLADSTTGFLVGQTQTPGGKDPATGVDTYSEYRIGGTSVSSPLFAGLMADVVQAVGKNVGFVNKTMYPFLARHDGAFRDPSIGRAAGAKRDGGTMAQTLSDATDTPDPTGTGLLGDTITAQAGSGPGVVPVLANVRADYTDPTDRTTAVNYTLRTLGNLGTLHDDPGFDDSTGLGTPYAPQFINDFLPGQPTASVPGTTPTTAPGTSPTTGPTTAPTTGPTTAPSSTPTGLPVPGQPGVACTIHGSAMKVTGPAKATRDRHGLVRYTFKLTVTGGSCKTPTSVGRQFFVYVDGHKAATLRTGKGGTIAYLVKVKPGKHTITTGFPGNRDLKKSSSNKLSVRIS